jgi:SAM-dependent methyltransferase
MSDYHAVAYRDYDAQNPDYKLNYYKQLVLEAKAPHTPKRIHDIGCAFGKFLSLFDQQWERFGSDIAEAAISSAREQYPDIHFRIASAAEALSAQAPAGVVTAWDVLEHLPDLDDVQEKIHQLLVTDGLFVFVVPVYDGLSGPIIRRLDKDPTHIHKWPRQQWLDWADRRFEVVSWSGILRYLMPWGQYLHMPLQRGKNHTPAIAVVCRKIGA